MKIKINKDFRLPVLKKINKNEFKHVLPLCSKEACLPTQHNNLTLKSSIQYTIYVVV